MDGASTRGNPRKVILLICLALVAVFVLFEVGVRLLPADAVQYEVQVSTNGGSVITRTGAITDPETVARWRAAVTADPSGQSLVGTLIAQQRGEITCAPLSSAAASYIFLWHGWPIESASTLPVCTETSMISRGGIPDLGTYNIELLIHP